MNEESNQEEPRVGCVTFFVVGFVLCVVGLFTFAFLTWACLYLMMWIQ
jgi:hypothetical protein